MRVLQDRFVIPYMIQDITFCFWLTLSQIFPVFGGLGLSKTPEKWVKNHLFIFQIQQILSACNPATRMEKTERAGKSVEPVWAGKHSGGSIMVQGSLL